MALPNFFIIGAAKAATTSLSSLLELHPQAGIAPLKETHFFSYEPRHRLGLEWYQQSFAHCSDRKAIGDASTSYSRVREYPAAPGRIKEVLPDAKFIYMVRHPLERMESAYVEIVCSEGSKPFASVNEAIRTQPTVLDSSRYWEVFDTYRQLFGESRIKVVWFEEYIANTTAVFQDVCRFLEIDDTVVPDLAQQKINSRDRSDERLAALNRSDLKIDTKWDENLRAWVIEQLREDNIKFLDHFGRPRDYWGDLFTPRKMPNMRRIEPPIFFVSGLPRSGSTLLMNLLGQNPAHHVTPTNDVLELIVTARDKWTKMPAFQWQGIDSLEPRMLRAMREILMGFFKEELAAGKIIFDKSRGWIAYIELIEQVLERPINVLVTVRDVRAIVASFEKLNRRYPITDSKSPAFQKSQTLEGRISRTLEDPGIVGIAINRLRDALARKHKSHIMLIPYNQLCLRPRQVMGAIHDALGLPAFKYDPENVKQVTVEDDAVHGMPLHTIRSKVELADTAPWEGILPESICEKISLQFEDIQRIAEFGS